MEPPRRWGGSTGFRRPEQPVQACGATDDKDLRKCRLLPLRDGSRLTTMIIQPRAVYAPRPPQVGRSTTTGHQSGPRDARGCGHGGGRHHAVTVLAEGLLRSRLYAPGSATRVLRIRGEHIRYPGLTRGRLVWRGVDDDRLVSGRGMEVFDQVPPG